MLKHIPKSDINLRPFKVYKTFTATENSSGSGYIVNIAEDSNDLGYNDSIILENKALYHRIKSMYYNGDNALNPFSSYGTFKPIYNVNETAKQRSLKERAIVLTIPQKAFGEEIKPNSIYLENLIGANNEEIYDDGYGNLISNYGSYTFTKMDIETKEFWFIDADNVLIKTYLVDYIAGAGLDIENGILLLLNEDTFYLIKIDVEESSISFLGIFKQTKVNVPIIGNVFYSHGIITITRETQNTGARKNALSKYSLTYKSTNTIYENEYLLVVGEDEFNVSTNPTAYSEINLTTGSISTTYEGNIKYKHSDKYQRTTLNNPYVSAHNGISSSGFDVYEYSSSIDPIGSYLAPYITTIGLYDDNMDMVAVAKLATPVKSMPDLPVNFLVRFDS